LEERPFIFLRQALWPKLVDCCIPCHSIGILYLNNTKFKQIATSLYPLLYGSQFLILYRESLLHVTF
jgi:hypothetical protein